jgi:hypothetical protein
LETANGADVSTGRGQLANQSAEPTQGFAVTLEDAPRNLQKCWVDQPLLVRCHKPLDEQSLREYMAEEHDLIGRKPDSTVTYTGHVTLRNENGVLQVTRTIEGKTDKCAAQFDTVAGDDRITSGETGFSFRRQAI